MRVFRQEKLFFFQYELFTKLIHTCAQDVAAGDYLSVVVQELLIPL